MKRPAIINRRIKEEKGFTLLEVIVAISLLTFGLLGVASMQVSAMKGNAFAGGVTEATTLAGDRLEYLMTLDYDDPADSGDPLDDVDGDGTAGLNDLTPATADHYRTFNSGSGIAYDIYWNTARDAPTTDTTTVKVLVTWKDHGILKKVSMQCIVAEVS